MKSLKTFESWKRFKLFEIFLQFQKDGKSMKKFLKLLSFSLFYLVILTHTQSNIVIQSHIQSYIAIHMHTQSNIVINSHTQSYRALHSQTKSHKAKCQYVCLFVNFALIEMLTHLKMTTLSRKLRHTAEASMTVFTNKREGQKHLISMCVKILYNFGMYVKFSFVILKNRLTNRRTQV